LGSEWPCVYRVAARPPGGLERELYRHAAEAPAPLAPARVELDLEAYRGARIELVLELEGEPPRNPRKTFPTASWGSPEVWSRRAPTRRAARQPSVLLIGVDALRADHVGPRGGRPSLTPALDRLAAQSDVWSEAYTCFNSTNSSFASMMTGLYAKNHGVYDLQTPLPAEHVTLAERFQAAGYRTLAVIGARHLGDHNSGLGQGFDRVELAERHFAAELGAALVADWLAESEQPFFVWLHLFDAHTPHTPPAPFSLGYRPARPAGPGPVVEWSPFREIGARVFDQPVLAGHRDLYAGEVAYVDRQLERLLAFLDSRGRLADTVIAVVADHGDNLGEHGVLYRHIGLHETVSRVPLVLRRPGAASGRRPAGLAQTIDLFPTLLAAAGLERPEGDGLDLLALAEGQPGRRAVFAEASHHQGAMVRRDAWKYIENRGAGPFPAVELYDLGRDPGEEHNLAGTGLAQERDLARLLAGWESERRPQPGAARARDLSEEEKARLRALGYL
ncbi:MAG TPA: sulfatase, partial [Thermoanaerobaculia bacterium]|nr:sulfatase [Thermoanaerobaculia bacterium]